MSNKVAYAPVKQDGNGITKDIPFGWKISAATDLIVIIEAADGTQAILTPNTGYTVTFDSRTNGTGGNVHLATANVTGTIAIVQRKIPNTQGSSYSTPGGFDAKEIEKSLDRNSMMIQDLNYDSKRTLKVKVGSSILDLTVPEPNAGKAIKWNADLTGLENSDVDIDDAIIAAAASATEAAAAQTSATAAATAAATSEANAQNYAAQTASTLSDVSAARNSALSAITTQQTTSTNAVQTAGVEQISLATAQATAAAASAAEAAVYAQQLEVSNVTFTATIGTTWVGSSAPFTQDVSIAGILAADNAIVGLIQSDTYATALMQLREYSKIKRAVSSADKVTFYASSPTSSPITVQIKAVR